MLAKSRSHILPLLERGGLYLGTKVLGISPLHLFTSNRGTSGQLETILKSPTLEGRLDVSILTRKRLLMEEFSEEHTSPGILEKIVEQFRLNRTPLLVSAYCGNLKQTQCLLADKRTDLDARAQKGRTALSLCVLHYGEFRFGCMDALESTVHAVLGTVSTAHINDRDGRGRTALAHAARSQLVTWAMPNTHCHKPRPWRFPDQQTERKIPRSMYRVVDRSDFLFGLVGLLLEMPGIDVNLLDDSEHTPLDYAI